MFYFISQCHASKDTTQNTHYILNANILNYHFDYTYIVSAADLVATPSYNLTTNKVSVNRFFLYPDAMRYTGNGRLCNYATHS